MNAKTIAAWTCILLATPSLGAAESRCALGERLLDGGFESATGDPARSPAWSELSTRFVSPLCTGTYCGFADRGIVAATGQAFAWFGGALAPESASLSQSLTLPASATGDLHFRLRRIGSGVAGDTLEVQMDDTTFANFSEPPSPECCYSEFVYPLDAFMDGDSHTLTFSYSGLSAEVSTFALDDVSVIVTACLPGSLFLDDFESGSTANWSASVP